MCHIRYTGSVMMEYNDNTAAFISLFRALFGDFNIDDIFDNSSGYLNVLLFLIYSALACLDPTPLGFVAQLSTPRRFANPWYEKPRAH